MIGKVIKDFKVIKELGKGGMATVFQVEHQLLGSTKAMKVLHLEYVRNENIRKRFIAEAKSMARMEHRNIITVTDLIDEGDTVAFLMEYVNGETLKEYSERKGKLSTDEIKTIFTQMLDAVGYVHKQNLIHRDIKPSNFMISKDGSVKLMDFGIAKNTDASSAEYTQTNTGMQMGTPMYMSPEQIKSSKDVGPQTDIYSLGVVLWQMVSGKKPYDTSVISSFDLQLKIVQDDLPLTNTVWDNCIKEATHKNIYLRFKSITAFQSSLPGNASEHTVIDEQKQTGFSGSPVKEKSETLESRFQNSSTKANDEKRSYALPLVIILIVVGLIGLYRYSNSGYNYSSIQDSDGDGVLDSKDLCPYEAGNDQWGCPEQDQDHDGVSDKNDKCPNQVGNDPNGCYYYKEVAFTNNSTDEALICVAYLHNDVWSVKGYYPIEAGKEFTFDLPYQFSGNEFFWYAQVNDDVQWSGTDRYFKIDDYDAFTVENNRFIEGGGNPIKRGFYKLNLTSEKTMQSFGY
jgi:serine/threonine protein kinase